MKYFFIIFFFLITCLTVFVFPKSVFACGDSGWAFYDFDDCPGAYNSNSSYITCPSTQIFVGSNKFVYCAYYGTNTDEYYSGSCQDSPSCSATQNCNTGASCTICNAPGNTCYSNNGTFSCTYYSYSGGGSCTPVQYYSGACTVDNCYSGYTCSGGSCVVSTPSCNTGASCTACGGAPANTCYTNNGTYSCSYTTYSGGGSCTPVVYGTYSCTQSNCSSGYTCSGGSCVVSTPSCNTGASCTACGGAPANTCYTNNGTYSCSYTTYSGGGSCTPVVYGTYSCTQSNCSSGYTCSGGSCVVPPTPTPACSYADIDGQTPVYLERCNGLNGPINDRCDTSATYQFANCNTLSGCYYSSSNSCSGGQLCRLKSNGQPECYTAVTPTPTLTPTPVCSYSDPGGDGYSERCIGVGGPISDYCDSSTSRRYALCNAVTGCYYGSSNSCSINESCGISSTGAPVCSAGATPTPTRTPTPTLTPTPVCSYSDPGGDGYSERCIGVGGPISDYCDSSTSRRYALCNAVTGCYYGSSNSCSINESCGISSTGAPVCSAGATPTPTRTPTPTLTPTPVCSYSDPGGDGYSERCIGVGGPISDYCDSSTSRRYALCNAVTGCYYGSSNSCSINESCGISSTGAPVCSAGATPTPTRTPTPTLTPTPVCSYSDPGGDGYSERCIGVGGPISDYCDSSTSRRYALCNAVTGCYYGSSNSCSINESCGISSTGAPVCSAGATPTPTATPTPACRYSDSGGDGYSETCINTGGGSISDYCDANTSSAKLAVCIPATGCSYVTNPCEVNESCSIISTGLALCSAIVTPTPTLTSTPACSYYDSGGEGYSETCLGLGGPISDYCDANTSSAKLAVCIPATGCSYVTNPCEVNESCSIISTGLALCSIITTPTPTPAIPSAPTLVSPSNGSTGVPTNPTMSWTSSNNLQSDGWYYLYYKRSSESSYGAVVINYPSTSYTFPSNGNEPGPLEANTTYQWYVKACNIGPKCGSPSSTWSFTTVGQICTPYTYRWVCTANSCSPITVNQ